MRHVRYGISWWDEGLAGAQLAAAAAAAAAVTIHMLLHRSARPTNMRLSALLRPACHPQACQRRCTAWEEARAAC